jgi:hypothetical protein
MSKNEMLKALLFFNEMELKIKQEIKETGLSTGKIFLLTDMVEADKNVVAMGDFPNFLDGDYSFTKVLLTVAYMNEFVSMVEKHENTKMLALFHCELSDDKLFTMRKIGKDDAAVKMFNLVRGESMVDERGVIVSPELEFEEVEE